MSFEPSQPFNALPLLPPAKDVESKAVLRQCIASRAALAELKRACEQIPNPAVLINTLPLLEARASSEIENVVTTADRLFRYLQLEGPADPATKEALRYRHALLEAFGTMRQVPLSTRTMEAVCSRIKDTPMRVRTKTGTRIVNSATGRAIYTPPQDETRLRELLTNWERYLHGKDGPDPLIRMAVLHYQFEAIHPFTDGNGRTGRVLNVLCLVAAGLVPLPVLYLSRHIIRHKADYYRHLLEVTTLGLWEPWLLYMLRGVEETAAWTVAKIDAVRALAAHTALHVRDRAAKVYSHELVELLFEQPYCRIANLVQAGIVGRQAASRYLKELVGAGVLREETVGRDKLFVHAKLLELLTSESNAWSPYA